MFRNVGILGLVLILVGCATAVPTCPLPKTVTVTVDRYITPDAALLKHVPTEKHRDDTCGEAVRVATVRASAISQCNAHLDAIKQATTDVTK